MMCIACEQQALWFAYLQKRGLITPDGRLVEDPPLFSADPIESPTPEEEKEESASKPADKAKFSCDDPKAG
jgi:hypothetical protein